MVELEGFKCAECACRVECEYIQEVGAALEHLVTTVTPEVYEGVCAVLRLNVKDCAYFE